MNEVYFPLRIMKVVRTVDVLVGLKRTGSHRSKLVTAGSVTFRPSISSTGVLPRVLDVIRCPRVLEVIRCVIRARCRKAPNETFRFGLQA